jgi:hypothetical protein
MKGEKIVDLTSWKHDNEMAHAIQFVATAYTVLNLFAILQSTC